MARIAALAICCSSAAALSSPAAGLQAQTAAPARAAVAAAPEPFLKDFDDRYASELEEWRRDEE